MIAFLKGKVTDSGENYIELDVGGVGYEITASTGAIIKYTSEQGEVTIPTYLQVREDAVCLYGFKDKNEKAMFLKLITVSGVGPKLAITILSGMSEQDLCIAIATDDVKMMSKVKGLGKKTAEKIIVELREKVGKLDKSCVALPLMANNTDPSVIEDAALALESLGLTSGDAYKIASKNATSEDTAETLIKKCLKDMAK